MPAWLLPALMMGGSILGKAGGKAAEERGNANDFQLRQNQLQQTANQADNTAALNANAQNETARMNRAQLGITAPQARLRQSLLASLMQNAKTARYTPPPGVRMGTVTGGLDLDTLINALARKDAGEMQGQASRALATGSDIPEFTDAASKITKSPVPGGYKNAGALESIFSGSGLLGSLLGGVLSAKNQGAGPTPNTPGFEYF